MCGPDENGDGIGELCDPCSSDANPCTQDEVCLPQLNASAPTWQPGWYVADCQATEEDETIVAIVEISTNFAAPPAQDELDNIAVNIAASLNVPRDRIQVTFKTVVDSGASSQRRMTLQTERIVLVVTILSAPEAEAVPAGVLAVQLTETINDGGFEGQSWAEELEEAIYVGETLLRTCSDGTVKAECDTPCKGLTCDGLSGVLPLWAEIVIIISVVAALFLVVCFFTPCGTCYKRRRARSDPAAQHATGSGVIGQVQVHVDNENDGDNDNEEEEEPQEAFLANLGLGIKLTKIPVEEPGPAASGSGGKKVAPSAVELVPLEQTASDRNFNHEELMEDLDTDASGTPLRPTVKLKVNVGAASDENNISPQMFATPRKQSVARQSENNKFLEGIEFVEEET